MKKSDEILLRKIIDQEIPLKFGNLKQIRLMHILRRAYLMGKYCEYFNKNQSELYRILN